MGARQDFTKAQTEIARQKELLARGKRSGNQTLVKAAQANIRVLEGRATTAFQQIAREEAVKAQARARAQAQAQQKAEAQRLAKERAEIQAQQQVVQIPVPVAPTPTQITPKESPRERAVRLREEAKIKRQQDAQRLADAKAAEEARAKEIFESEKIQKEAKPAFETGTEFRLSELEKRREAAIELAEATKAKERLEAGTTVFETGAGFDPVPLESGRGQEFARSEEGKDVEGTIFSVKEGIVTERPKKDILPGEPEGVFISGQIQAQQVDALSDVLDIEKQIAAIKTEIPGTPEFRRDPEDPDDRGGVAALEVLQETRGIEATPDLFPGSTVIGTAEEFGVAVKTKEKFNGETFEFPALSGDLIADVEKPSEIAERTGEDPFVVAQSIREETGLVPGEPVKFGNLLGFDVPEKTLQPTVTKSKSQDPLLVLQSSGLPVRPAEQLKIETGFIPFAQPISEPKTPPPKRGKSSVFLPPTSAGLIASPATVIPSVQNFDNFLAGLGSSFNISADLFETVSSGLSFGNIFGTKPLPKRKQTASQIKASNKAKAQAEIANRKRRGLSVSTSLIAKAFPDKTKRAKAAGFQVSSTGKVFEGSRTKGSLGISGTSVAQVKAKRAEIIRKKKEAERKAREKAARIAAEKRRRAIRRRQKKGRSKGARAPSVKSPAKGKTITTTRRGRTTTIRQKPSKQKRSSSISQLAIRSPSIPTVGAVRFGSGKKSKPKPKTPKKSTPGIFGGGFGGGRRFG